MHLMVQNKNADCMMQTSTSYMHNLYPDYFLTIVPYVWFSTLVLFIGYRGYGLLEHHARFGRDIGTKARASTMS